MTAASLGVPWRDGGDRLHHDYEHGGLEVATDGPALCECGRGSHAGEFNRGDRDCRSISGPDTSINNRTEQGRIKCQHPITISHLLQPTTSISLPLRPILAHRWLPNVLYDL